MAGLSSIRTGGYLVTLLSLLYKYNFHHFLILGFILVPGVIGTYHYLAAQIGMPVYFAAPTALGIEVGGAFVDVFNTLILFPDATLPEKVALGIGVLAPLHKVVYLFWGWWKVNMFFNTETQANYFVLLLGAVFFALLTGFTLVVDWFAIPYYAEGGVTRPPGVSYALANFGEVVLPYYESAFEVGQDLVTPGGANQTINNTIGNSTSAVNASG